MPTSSLTPDLICNLLDGGVFPHETGTPELIETHISWVILAGPFAYKIKKPVDLGFLDFSTLELRRHFCDEELRLNRRFAPAIYLDVMPIGGSPSRPRIDAEPAIEWAVRMRRFSADAGLDHRVPANRVTADDLRDFGEALALIHANASISDDPAHGSFESIVEPAMDNFASLERECGDAPAITGPADRLKNWTVAEGESLRPLFEQRVGQGHIRECHGDLHLGNIVYIDDACVAFDCLEFNPAFRWIDVISDVGFLVMDLLHFGRAELACAFLNRYLEVSGDYAGVATLPFYGTYRALVRAKTSAVRIAQQGPGHDLSDIAAYLDVGSRIAYPQSTPVLIICHGLSGSGKTWVSDRLIPAFPAIRIRSDIVRKQLHGFGELERSGAELNRGLYAPDATLATYARLAAFAEIGLRAGLNVIVDATFLRGADRDRLIAVGDACDAACAILHCVARPAVLEARVRDRHAAGADASEADLAVLHTQQDAQEPLEESEQERAVIVDTDREIDFTELVRALRTAGTKKAVRD